MRSFFRKLLAWLAPKKKRVRRKRAPKAPGDVGYGQFTSIKSVLNTLDAMFEDIARLTPKKSHMQKLVQRYGPYVGSLSEMDYGPKDEGDGIAVDGFESGLRAYGLPSMLISYFDRGWKVEKNDETLSDFLICHKTDKIPFFRKKEGRAYYDCNYIFMLPPEHGVFDQSKAKPFEITFYIEVNIESAIAEAYPYLAEKEVVINGRKVSGKRSLHYPDLIQPTESESKKRQKAHHSQVEIREHLTQLFYLHYNSVMRREMGINIIVKKGHHRATIVVPPNMWKEFFRERDHVYNKAGNKKRIFHAVSSHFRERKGRWWQFWIKAKISTVKTHYRGLREFMWEGYEILIVLPGKHGASQASLGIEAKYERDVPPGIKMVDTAKKGIADKLNGLFEGRAA